eukprot:8590629-Pyramimonas_sp.AAC.1
MSSQQSYNIWSCKYLKCWSVALVAQSTRAFANTTYTLGHTFNMPLQVVEDADTFGKDSMPPWAEVHLAPKRRAKGDPDGAQPSQKEPKGDGKGENKDSLVTKVAMLSLATAREQALLSTVVLSTYLVSAGPYLAKG